MRQDDLPTSWRSAALCYGHPINGLVALPAARGRQRGSGPAVSTQRSAPGLSPLPNHAFRERTGVPRPSPRIDRTPPAARPRRREGSPVPVQALAVRASRPARRLLATRAVAQPRRRNRTLPTTCWRAESDTLSRRAKRGSAPTRRRKPWGWPDACLTARKRPSKGDQNAQARTDHPPNPGLGRCAP